MGGRRASPHRSTAASTSRWRSRSAGPGRVTGAAARSQTPWCPRPRPAAARRSRRTRRRARRRARAARTARRPRGGARRRRRAGNRSSGTSPATARAGRPSGRGRRSRSSVAPHPRCSSSCSSDPATPGIETSRAARHGPASATSTSASPSSRSRAAGRSRSELKIGVSWRCVPALEAERDEQRVAGARVGRAEQGAGGARCRTPTARGASPIVRWPPTTSTPSRPAAHASPSSSGSACARSGLTSVSTSASGRPPIARMSETFVDHRRGAGGERVSARRGRVDRLGAHEQEAVAVRDRGAVVAVERGRRAGVEEVQVALGRAARASCGAWRRAVAGSGIERRGDSRPVCTPRF